MKLAHSQVGAFLGIVLALLSLFVGGPYLLVAAVVAVCLGLLL